LVTILTMSTQSSDPMDGQTFIIPSKSQCIYTSCYCEENIYKLGEQLLKLNGDKFLDSCFVVFISNPAQKVPVWRQQTGDETRGHLALWDYHVIMIHHVPRSVVVKKIADETSDGMVLDSTHEPRILVYDLDTTLPFPCQATLYSWEAFRDDRLLKPEYHHRFRIVPLKDYLEWFSSDRSRMKRSDGSWIMPPPPYPPICGKNGQVPSNIHLFINTDIESGDSNTPSWLGKVVTLEQFNEQLGPKRLSQSQILSSS